MTPQTARSIPAGVGRVFPRSAGREEAPRRPLLTVMAKLEQDGYADGFPTFRLAGVVVPDGTPLKGQLYDVQNRKIEPLTLGKIRYPMPGTVVFEYEGGFTSGNAGRYLDYFWPDEPSKR